MPPVRKKIDIVAAMSQNRHERRRLGKINKSKIPGVRRPIKGKQKSGNFGIETRNEKNTIQTKEEHPKEGFTLDPESVSKALKEINYTKKTS